MELRKAIQLAKATGATDKEILELLKATGYEGDSLPAGLESVIPSANEVGTIPVTTLEGMMHEQRASERGVVTEMQKTMDTAARLHEIEHAHKMKKE